MVVMGMANLSKNHKHYKTLKKKMKEVKKRSKKLDFYLCIIEEIKNTNSIQGAYTKLDISKQKLNYYIVFLKRKGFIKKISYGVWELSKDYEEVKKEVKKISLGTKAEKPLTNLHALQINFPILAGKIRDKEWKIKEKLNNWIPKYKKLDIMGGLTIKNNNNKSITVFVNSRNIETLEEVNNLAFKIRAYIFDYFKREGVVLDVFNCKTTNLNVATEDKKAEGMITKGEKIELDLKKKSEKIFKKDDINAKAWIDGSPFKFSAETNDLEWKREYLSMPFRIKDTMEVLNAMAYNLSYVAENYKSHVGLVKEGMKMFKKLNTKLSQKKLNEYF